jgi:hypothetical protein
MYLAPAAVMEDAASHCREVTARKDRRTDAENDFLDGAFTKAGLLQVALFANLIDVHIPAPARCLAHEFWSSVRRADRFERLLLSFIMLGGASSCVG